jgi:hypothetical protein
LFNPLSNQSLVEMLGPSTLRNIAGNIRKGTFGMAIRTDFRRCISLKYITTLTAHPVVHLFFLS